MVKDWVERKKPARLEKKLEFSDYEETREFLEKAADLAEQEDNYPDMSFGRTFVSITLYPRDEQAPVDDGLHQYAKQMDQLAEAARTVC